MARKWKTINRSNEEKFSLVHRNVCLGVSAIERVAKRLSVTIISVGSSEQMGMVCGGKGVAQQA